MARTWANHPPRIVEKMEHPHAPSGGELVVSQKDETPAIIQRSPLLRMPPEVRRMIYIESFKNGLFCRCEDPKAATRPPKAPDGLGLLSTCKQLRQEALPHAFETVILCRNPKHAQHLRNLSDLNIQAFFSIQHLYLNITCHQEKQCADCGKRWGDPMTQYAADTVFEFGTQEWDTVITDLVTSKQLNLESLYANFVCLHSKCINALHLDNPFPLAVKALKPSCRKIAVQGIFWAHSVGVETLSNGTLRDLENGLYWHLQAGIVNADYKQKWKEIQLAQEETLSRI